MFPQIEVTTCLRHLLATKTIDVHEFGQESQRRRNRENYETESECILGVFVCAIRSPVDTPRHGFRRLLLAVSERLREMCARSYSKLA